MTTLRHKFMNATMWPFERKKRAAFFAAVKNNDLQAVEATLTALPRAVHWRDKSGATALIASASNGHADMCALLLKHGADIEAKYIKSWTPLLCAAHANHDNCVKLLAEHGADIHAAASKKRPMTVLDFCLKGSRPASVRLLLEKKAAFRLYNFPLHSALTFSNCDEILVDALLDGGCALDARNENGETPLLAAMKRGAIVNLVQSGLPVVRLPQPLIIQRLNLPVIRRLIERGADLDAADSDGNTPRKQAARTPAYAVLLAEHDRKIQAVRTAAAVARISSGTAQTIRVKPLKLRKGKPPSPLSS